MNIVEELAVMILKFEQDYSYSEDDWVLNQSREQIQDLNAICNQARMVLGLPIKRPDGVLNYKYFEDV